MPRVGRTSCAPNVPAKSMRDRRTDFLRRAAAALHDNVDLRALAPDQRRFWLQIVLDIHEVGDGATIGFGSVSDRYRSRARLLATHERSEADLVELCHHGLLLGLESGGLGIPPGLGLAPQRETEKAACDPFKPIVIEGGGGGHDSA